MARITVDQQSVIVDADERELLWHSRLEIPITQVVRAEVARIRGDSVHSSGMTSAGSFLHHGHDAFFDVREQMPLVVIHLRDQRYQRLFVHVDDPREAVARIQREIQRSQLPANALAFLLGVLESQEPVAAAIRSMWESDGHGSLASAIPSPTEVARAVLSEEAFEGARAAGRAASRELQLAGHPSSAAHPPRASVAYQCSDWDGIRLSAREREVLGLVAEGCSNQRIGSALSISERTARYHVTSIFNKLGADNRAHAVALAAQRGLLA